MFKWNNFQVFLSDAWNILFRTILHSIHQPSWHGHPTIMKYSPQPQNVAILRVCSRCSRWYSYFMFTSIVQPTVASKLKGFMSQNCLFACNFNFQLFCYTRWEGYATDAQVSEAGLQAVVDISNGHYYLADTSYLPMSKHVLTPHHGVQYHLAEWSWAEKSEWFSIYVQSPLIQSFRQCTKEELFNLQHISACNVIEQIFGVLKCRFWILLIALEYSLKIQACIPAALATVHNFIHHYEMRSSIMRSWSVGWLKMMMMMQSGLMEGWVNKMQGGPVLPVWCGSSTKVKMLIGGFLPPVEYRDKCKCFWTYFEIYCPMSYPALNNLTTIQWAHIQVYIAGAPIICWTCKYIATHQTAMEYVYTI